ncbi:glycosyltransferase [Halomonas mongoliensis]|uniref:glycosyltransferase n=1 Tax=Halomonas mongoliensis TaxID=321265 RepID=UPI00403AADEA
MNMKREEVAMRSEAEIMRSWSAGQGGLPLVSIECTTYNHAAYIAGALEGMLAQETHFPFEIIVNDDASSDATADIIRDFQRRYPGLIRANLHRDNQLSQGISPLTHTLPLCRGRYTAFCEGDDAWTDPHKLQRQIDMLEQHPECDMAFHAADKCYSDGRLSTIGHYGSRPRIVSAEEVIEKRHGGIPTASTVVRTPLLHELQRFMDGQEDKLVSDVYLEAIAARRGGACYLPESMSIYRYQVPGSWSSRQASEPFRKLTRLRQRVHSFQRLDEWLGWHFTVSFQLANRDLIFKAVKLAEASHEARSSFYAEFGGLLGARDRCLARLLLAWPGSIACYRSLRAYLSGLLPAGKRRSGRWRGKNLMIGTTEERRP